MSKPNTKARSKKEINQMLSGAAILLFIAILFTALILGGVLR